MKKVKANKRYKFLGIRLRSYGGAMQSRGKIVSNSIIALYGDRWLLDLLWLPHCKVSNVESLCLHLKLILYADYTLIKKI